MTSVVDAPQLQSAAPLNCKNCAAPLGGHYCAHCGQEAQIETPTVGEFVREFLQDQVALEGKLLRTLKVLVAKPGQLTLDYIDGRRQRYIRPLRLYLTLSVVYFAVAGLSGNSDSSVSDAHKHVKQVLTQHDGKPATDADGKQPGDRGGTDSNTDSNTDTDADTDHSDADDSSSEAANGDADSANVQPKSPPAPPPPNVVGAPTPGAPTATVDSAQESKTVDGSGKNAAPTDGAPHDKNDGLVVFDSPKEYSQLREIKTGYAPLDLRINRFFNRPERRALSDFQSAVRSDAPIAVFFVLPLFAALLKLGYLRHHLRYGVHVLFSLHLHAFVFFDLLISVLPWPGIIEFVLKAAIPVYLLLALQRVYGGGRTATGFFVAGLMLVHAIFIGIALMLAAVVTVAINS